MSFLPSALGVPICEMGVVIRLMVPMRQVSDGLQSAQPLVRAAYTLVPVISKPGFGSCWLWHFRMHLTLMPWVDVQVLF